VAFGGLLTTSRPIDEELTALRDLNEEPQDPNLKKIRVLLRVGIPMAQIKAALDLLKASHGAPLALNSNTAVPQWSRGSTSPTAKT
jgi:DNA-binding transcriptional MerR regulator